MYYSTNIAFVLNTKLIQVFTKKFKTFRQKFSVSFSFDEKLCCFEFRNKKYNAANAQFERDIASHVYL